MKKSVKKIKKSNNMKVIKVLTIILFIVLISLISYIGIYVQNKNQISNTVKDYIYAMDLEGSRTVKLKLNSSTKTVVKDNEGNIVENVTDEEIEENGYIKEEVANNSEEAKIEENFNKSKQIIEKRLRKLNVQDYKCNVNKENGEIIIQIPENSNTDLIVGNINSIGKFEIIDSQTNEVLMNNDDIKSSNVLYNTTQSGTSVYLEIAFTKEGKNKLEEMSKIYVETLESDNIIEDTETEDEEEKVAEEESSEKKITMKIDDQEIMTTYFSDPITNGKIQLSVGTATTDMSTLQNYINQTQNMATVLDCGNMPLQYDLEKNQFILSEVLEQQLVYVAIIVVAISLIGIIILIIKYKTNGLLAGISYIGLVAVYLLLIRYANVIVSIESITAIITILILNYIFVEILLKGIKNNITRKIEKPVTKASIETYKKFFIRIVPICVIAVAFCFVKWIPISSFGMTTFWGLSTIAIYNIVVTNTLLKIKLENK